eukprot:407483-Prorocentrum_minimum.AAC.2
MHYLIQELNPEHKSTPAAVVHVRRTTPKPAKPANERSAPSPTPRPPTTLRPFRLRIFTLISVEASKQGRPANSTTPARKTRVATCVLVV